MTTRIATSDLHSLTISGVYIADGSLVTELADTADANRPELIRCLCERGYRRLAGAIVRRWSAWERQDTDSAEAALADLWPMHEA